MTGLLAVRSSGPADSVPGRRSRSRSDAAGARFIDDITEIALNGARPRTYLGDEIITGMARRMLFEVVGERPGADLMEALRTVPLPLALVGITVAALAKAMQHRRRGVRHERTRARRAGRGRVLVHPGPADAGFSCHARPGPSPASSRQDPECCPRGQGCPCAEVLAAGVRLS